MSRDKNAIVFVRGDSYSRTINITHNGIPVDLTGASVVMTVATAENPTDETTKLFEVAGVVDDVAPGRVHFTPTAINNGVAGQYFYDVQVTDAAGNIRTPIKSRYTITQDITK